MDDKDNQKEVVIIKEEDDNDKKNKKKRLIAILITLGILVVDLVIASIIFIPKIIKYANKQDSEYIISKETIDTYDNLLGYINKELSSASYSNATEIVSISYKDNKLNVSYKNDNEPGYMNIDTSSSTFNESLDKFKSSSYHPGSFDVSINKETFNQNKEVNVDYKNNIKGMVTTYGTSDYISFTCLSNKNEYASLCHEEYLDSGSYTNITYIKMSENRSLYDMFYYIVNE